MSDAQKFEFEPALSRLQEIVQKLESGQLRLEESMTVFEEGIRITRACQAYLAQAEQKIQQLSLQSGEKAEFTQFKP